MLYPPLCPWPLAAMRRAGYPLEIPNTVTLGTAHQPQTSGGTGTVL